MSMDDFTKLAAVLFLFLGGCVTAVFAYAAVKNKHTGDAIKATADAVVALSERISVLEAEREELLARIDDLTRDVASRDLKIEQLQRRVADLEAENHQLKNKKWDAG